MFNQDANHAMLQSSDSSLPIGTATVRNLSSEWCFNLSLLDLHRAIFTLIRGVAFDIGCQIERDFYCTVVQLNVFGRHRLLDVVTGSRTQERELKTWAESLYSLTLQSIQIRSNFDGGIVFRQTNTRSAIPNFGCRGNGRW
jgi:hypothetical protein